MQRSTHGAIKNRLRRTEASHIVATHVLSDQLVGNIMPDNYPEKTCSIDRLVTHAKLVSAALDGSKTQQRRAGVYGYPGETFSLEGSDFEITGLRTERWGDITEEDAQREGYPNLAMYQALIERMHKGMEWNQDQPVWVHEFTKLEAS